LSGKEILSGMQPENASVCRQSRFHPVEMFCFAQPECYIPAVLL
jgi:hypothetical protein